MATNIKLRWKPDQFKTNLEAMVMGESGDGTTGSVILTAQAFIFDDSEIANVNTIIPGDNATEKFITVCHEGAVQLDMPVLAGMTIANRNAALDAALDGWGTANHGDIQAMAKINRSARRRNPRNLVAPA